MTEEELQAVAVEYRARLKAGEDLEPEEEVMRHPPDVAAELLDLLTGEHALFHARRRPQVHGYVLHRPLASGGQAVVYRATDTESGTQVAVKVFQTGNADRFRGEVKALRSLNHPHIVAIERDGTTADGHPFLAMRLYPNGSLNQRYPTPETVPAGKVAVVMIQLTDAVTAAHDLGIIHRDIKPSNVLIDDFDNPRLTDFGLAHLDDPTQPALTRTGAVLGTGPFMSPEQAAGDSHLVTVRSDVYGLGAVLYWLLTGRRPFGPERDDHPFAPGEYDEMLRQVKVTPPRRPRDLNPNAPQGLETICLKCLEKRPTDRYPSAAALATALRDWVSGKEPPRPGLFDRLCKWWRKRSVRFRTWATAVGVMLAVLLVAGVSVLLISQQADLHRQRADLADKEKAVFAEARAQVAVRNALDRGWQLLRAKQMGWTPKLHADLAEVYRESKALKEADREAAHLEARSLYAMSLAWVDIEPVEKGRLDMPPSHFAAWPAVPHPGGKWIAVGTPQGPFRFQPGEMDKPPDNTAAPPPGQGMPRVAYRPDGEVLAFAPATGGLQLWDGTVSKKLADVDTGNSPVLAVGFAPGGMVRACRTDGRVISWKDGEKTEVDLKGELTAARFTADASKLAVGDKTGKVRECTADGKDVRPWDGTDVRTEVQSLAWAPGGGLAAGFKEGVVIAWNKEGAVDHRFAVFANGVDALDYSPDGSSFSAFRVMERSHWWDADTGERLLAGGDRQVTGPNGRAVATSGMNFVALARWVGSDVVRVLRGHRTDVAQLLWAPSGDFLASLDTRRELRVWDAAKGRLIDRVDAPVGEFYAYNAGLALSPDGRYLAYSYGGPPGAKGGALIRDTTTRTTLKEWELPPGFDRLAWESDNQFVMVRDEFVAETEVLETVVRRLAADRPPTSARRVLRRARPTDTRRRVGDRLTPDGRHYVWWGPRRPEDQRRVEVLEVATGRKLAEWQLPDSPKYQEPDVRLSALTNKLRVEFGDEVRVWKLPSELGGLATPCLAEEWFQNGRLVAMSEPGQSFPSVFPPNLSYAWFQLGSSRMHNPTTSDVFSHNREAGRLAWSTGNGAVLTADVGELAKAVEQFEARSR